MNDEQAAPVVRSASAERKRRWKLRLLAVGFGLILAFVLAEVTFRIYVAARGWTPNCYLPQSQMIAPHETSGYELRPGFHYRSGTTEIEINSHGLRSPEPTGERPLIVTLGGSAAFGYLVSDGETAADLLRQRCRREGIEIDVQNGGVPGYNLFQTMVRYGERCAPLEPDYVVLYLGWNDTPYIVSDRPERARFVRTPAPSRFERTMSHSTVYGFVKSKFLGKNLKLVPPVSESASPTQAGAARFRENLDQLADDVERDGAKLIVCSQVMAAHPEADPSLYRFLDDDPERREELIELGQWLHDELREFAIARDAIWIDAWIPPDEKLLGDAIHLTQEGEARLAEIWFENLLAAGVFGAD